jgi:hypothetical protein
MSGEAAKGSLPPTGIRQQNHACRQRRVKAEVDHAPCGLALSHLFADTLVDQGVGINRLPHGQDDADNAGQAAPKRRVQAPRRWQWRKASSVGIDFLSAQGLGPPDTLGRILLVAQ